MTMVHRTAAGLTYALMGGNLGHRAGQSCPPDVQEQSLAVYVLDGAGLALGAPGCHVHNVPHTYLLPCGILSMAATTRDHSLCMQHIHSADPLH